MNGVMRNGYQIDWEQWSPSQVAVLCFVVSDEQVLLIEKLRGLGAGKVNAPGGRIEENETPEEAAVREVQEEVSITPYNLQKLGNLKFAFVDGLHLECWVFLADEFTGVPQESPEAIPFWQSIDNLPYERMWSDDKEWIPHLLERKTFVGQFVFDGDRMVSGVVSLTESLLG